MNPYFSGLIFGLIILYLSYLCFGKKIGKVYYAPIFTFTIGSLVLLYSLIFIKIFQGFGMSFLSYGILTIAFLGAIYLLIKKHPWSVSKKQFTRADKGSFIILPVIFTGLIALGIFGNSYWVLENTRATEVFTIDQYVIQLQESPDIQGFKRFTVDEENKMIVLSLGEDNQGKGIEVMEVDQDESTTITVKLIEKTAITEDNPYILIGLHEIKDPIIVKTEGGLFFDELD